MMIRAIAGSLFVLFVVLVTGARAQYVFPTPTPSPSPSPSPRPSPSVTPTPGPAPCPSIKVQAQAGRWVRDGQPIAFALNMAGGDPKVMPTIIWSLSAGTILKGQSTRRIDVDTTGAGSSANREVRADVWVGGYAPQCVVQASGTVTIIAPATKFGDFGVVDDATFKRNIDALSKYLAESPDNLYVIAYAGRTSERGFSFTWLRRIRESLVTAGIPERRIATIDGGFREEPLFDFWIVPRGAEPPRPAPTIKANEIVRPKTRPG